MSIISDVETQVRDRLKELEPLVVEYRQLQEVLATFERTSSPAAQSVAVASPRRRRASSRANGGRSAEAMSLVSGSPGLTVAELADKMNIGPTYLYRLLPALEKEGKLRKEGKGYHPA